MSTEGEPSGIDAFVALTASVLERPSEEVWGLIDVDVLEAVLAGVGEVAAGGAPVRTQAAHLLVGLVRERPLSEANDAMAVAAALQLPALGGVVLDLGPPVVSGHFFTSVAAGSKGVEDVIDWFARPSWCWGSQVCCDPAGARLGTSAPVVGFTTWSVVKPTNDQTIPGLGTEILADSVRRALALAEEGARRTGHGEVDTGHLLLGLLRIPHAGAVRLLQSLGVPLEAVRRRLEELTEPSVPPPGGPLTFNEATKHVLEASLREP